jgi:acyl-coenzyme A thioesterase PaaI-like protein
MKFFHGDGALFSWLTVPDHLCGWDNLVHGGVLATVLDETMGWTAIHFLKKFALTNSLTVEYLKSVRIGEQIRVEGRVLESDGKREATVEGLIYRNGDDVLCARSKGLFRLFNPGAIARLGVMDKESAEKFDFLIQR